MLRNSRFKTFVWYTGVGMLVLFAVAVSLFRIYFTTVEEYRSQLEVLAGSYLGQPVTISEMDARVVGISPTVILNDVALLHKGGEQLLTRFASIAITLDPIASLRNLNPIIELTVSGARLEVTRNADGTFGVQGLELAARQKEQGVMGAEATQSALETGRVLGAWFLGQNRLALRDSRIIFHDQISGERFNFASVELELRNDGLRHRLNGFVHLPESIGRELRVAVDFEGDLLQSKEWGGDFYLKTAALHPQQWLSQLSWQGTSLQDGVLDLELWTRWQGGRLESVHTRLQASELVLARGEQRQAIARISSDARLQRLPAGWQLDLAGLSLQLGEDALVPLHLALTHSDSGSALQADRLPLQAVAVLLPFLPVLDERLQAMVRQMAPAGLLQGLRVELGADKRLELQGALKGLRIAPWERVPGLSSVDAQFHFSGDHGEVQLSIDEGALELPRLFREPIALERVRGALFIQRGEGGWRLYGEQLAVRNQDLNAELDLALQLQPGLAPWLSLQGRFSGNDATAVPRYLPAVIMKEKSLHWLDNAFKAGSVPRGSMQFHGFTNQFPFRQQQGRFEVLFDAEGVGLHYQDGWPELTQLAGEVHFDGLGMRIAAQGARLFDARLGPTSVSIDNLREAQLLVEGGGQFPLTDGLRFLRESPLSKHTGKMLDTMRGDGDATLALKLAIPIAAQLRESRPLRVNGTLDFKDNRLDIIDGVSMGGLTGSLAFTEKSFQADRLTAELYGRPASLVVLTADGAIPQVVVAARGSAVVPALRKALKLPLLDYMEGLAEWQASLNLPRGNSADGVMLRIRSDLKGVSSSLPHPLAKGEAEIREMVFAFHLSGERAGENSLRVGDKFAMVWRQGDSGNGRGIRRLQLQLGAASELALPRHDVIELRGSGEGLVIPEWRAVLQHLRGEGGDSQPPLPLVVAMKRLQLLSGDGGGADSSLKVADVPALSFDVEQFTYDEMPLGRVSVRLLPEGRQLAIKELLAQSDLFKVTGEGAWAEQGNTFFNLKLETSNLGGMLKRLGFASVIRDGKGHASGKVWWAGSPTQVSLAGLNAQLALAMKEGTIVDVDPGAGRMLGILSIPALPRRLFLDFSDVFKQGLEFDKIQGDIRIEEGHAYTSNLRVESVPASVLLSGRTGLVAQDFDQEVYVVPNVSDTATVASALAWGPQVAAVVALMQEIFKSDIKAATMSRYHITGGWREPVIQRVMEQGGATRETQDTYFVD